MYRASPDESVKNYPKRLIYLVGGESEYVSRFTGQCQVLGVSCTTVAASYYKCGVRTIISFWDDEIQKVYELLSGLEIPTIDELNSEISQVESLTLFGFSDSLVNKVLRKEVKFTPCELRTHVALDYRTDGTEGTDATIEMMCCLFKYNRDNVKLKQFTVRGNRVEGCVISATIGAWEYFFNCEPLHHNIRYVIEKDLHFYIPANTGVSIEDDCESHGVDNETWGR